MANFPGPIIKPADIATGEDILASHVGPLWDETIAIAAYVLTNEADIATNAAAIAVNAGAIATNASDISTLQSDVSTAQADILTNAGDIATNAGDISTLQGDVSTLQTDVATAQGDIVTLQTDVSTAQSDIATLQSDVTNLGTDKQDISEKGVAGGYASLDGSGKIPASQLTVSALEYLGMWDASINSPALADGTGTTGDMYRVSVAGSQDLGSGSITFDVGDYAIHNGATWEKADTTDAVSSVAGKTGAVTLVEADITDLQAYALASDLSDHLADAVDAHDASAISNVPAGNIAATDVQGAIDELDSEKASTTHTHVEADITDLGDYVDRTGDTMAGNLNFAGFQLNDAGKVDIYGTGQVFEIYDSSSDANPRFAVRGADGALQMGPGGGTAPTVQLQLQAAGQMTLAGIGSGSGTGQFLASTQLISEKLILDPTPTHGSAGTGSVEIDGNTSTPTFSLGSGAAAVDWTMQRTGAGVVEITLGGLTTGDVGFHGVAPVTQSAHIPDATGGATVDAEARAAINAALVVLEAHGLTATS